MDADHDDVVWNNVLSEIQSSEVEYGSVDDGDLHYNEGHMFTEADMSQLFESKWRWMWRIWINC